MDEIQSNRSFATLIAIGILGASAMLAAGGCATHRMDNPVAREAIRNGGNPEYFRIKDKDPAMRNAVHMARKTVAHL